MKKDIVLKSETDSIQTTQNNQESFRLIVTEKLNIDANGKPARIIAYGTVAVGVLLAAGYAFSKRNNGFDFERLGDGFEKLTFDSGFDSFGKLNL